MRRKDLLPRDTFLYCVVDDVSEPWIFTGFFCGVDGDFAIISDSGLNRVRIGSNNVRFLLHHCFFTEEGAKAYIRDVLGGGGA